MNALSSADHEHLIDRYLHPQPRISLAGALRDHARAAMDVSDGLAGDLAKMLRASGVTATVDAESIPLSVAARAALAADPELIDRLLTGGDDYEILCAVPPEHLDALAAKAREVGVPLVPIGEIVHGTGLPTFRLGDAEQRFPNGSFSHF